MTQPIRTRLTIIYCTVFCFGATVLEVGAYEALQLAVSAIADRDLNARLAGVEEFLNDHLPRMRLARMQKELKTHAALQPDLLRIAADQWFLKLPHWQGTPQRPIAQHPERGPLGTSKGHFA